MKSTFSILLTAILWLFSGFTPITASESTAYWYPLLEAELALGRNMPQVALQNYIAVARETQDPKIAARATEVALTVAGFEEAIEPAMLWADNAPDNIEAQLTITLLLIKTQQAKRIQPYLKHLLALDNPDIDKELLGLFRQIGNETEEAAFIAQLQQLRKSHRKHAAIPLALAEIHLFQGQIKTTLTESKQALRLDPSVTRAMLMYAQALLSLNQQKQAVEFLETNLKKYPQDAVLKQFYVEILLELNQTEAAKVVLNELAKMPNLAPNNQLQLAKMAIDAGWLAEAQQLLLNAEKRPEQADTARYLLARIAEINNDIDGAINWYSAVHSGPFYILSKTEASHLLVINQQYEQALKIIENTEPQTLSDYKKLMLSKASILDKSGQHDKSFQFINNFLKDYPDDIDFLYARSLIADKLNNRAQAEKDLKAILAIDPNHVNALNALGYILANAEIKFDEAYQYLMRANQLSPHNASIMDSIGWLEFKRKRYSEAVKWLKKALEINPDPEIAAHLGEALWHARKKDQAEKIWDQAIQAHPNHEILINTINRLSKQPIKTKP